MTRFGWAMLAALLLLAIALATVIRVTGPGLGSAPRVAAPMPAPQAAAPATLLVPVRGVAGSTLVDSWGDARGDGTRAHHAIDILAPRGTPVIAAAPGRIEKLFTSALGGLTIYERSTDGGLVFYYAHLDSYAPGLAEGAAVRAGETLGAVGTSGDAEGGAAHLHFEVHRMAPGERWWQGEEMDPFPMLRGPTR